MFTHQREIPPKYYVLRKNVILSLCKPKILLVQKYNHQKILNNKKSIERGFCFFCESNLTRIL